jgi:hypothetical protein
MQNCPPAEHDQIQSSDHLRPVNEGLHRGGGRSYVTGQPKYENNVPESSGEDAAENYPKSRLQKTWGTTAQYTMLTPRAGGAQIPREMVKYFYPGGRADLEKYLPDTGQAEDYRLESLPVGNETRVRHSSHKLHRAIGVDDVQRQEWPETQKAGRIVGVTNLRQARSSTSVSLSSPNSITSGDTRYANSRFYEPHYGTMNTLHEEASSTQQADTSTTRFSGGTRHTNTFQHPDSTAFRRGSDMSLPFESGHTTRNTSTEWYLRPPRATTRSHEYPSSGSTVLPRHSHRRRPISQISDAQRQEAFVARGYIPASYALSSMHRLSPDPWTDQRWIDELVNREDQPPRQVNRGNRRRREYYGNRHQAGTYGGDQQRASYGGDQQHRPSSYLDRYSTQPPQAYSGYLDEYPSQPRDYTDYPGSFGSQPRGYGDRKGLD